VTRRPAAVEAEDVPHLEQAARLRDDRCEAAPIVHREGERLPEEAVAARTQALPGQVQMVSAAVTMSIASTWGSA